MLKTVSSITNAIGALNYKGTWNASTNTPTLASGVGTKGDYYVVSVAGSTALDGISNWGVGDLATYNGAAWQRVEGGADLNGVNLSVSGTSTLSGLTASTALALDASKNVVSVTNTGSGNNVLATSPALAGPSYLASAPATITGRKNDFSSGQVTMENSTIDLCTIPAAATGLSGMVFVACETSAGIGFGYIIYFVMSNNAFTATALAAGSSQGTHTATLSLSGTTIRLTTTYTGGIGGSATGTAAGFVVVNNF
jgi:hypothetical protein